MTSKDKHPQKYDIKVVVGVLFFLLLIGASTTTFLDMTINHNHLHMNMFEVRGVRLVTTAGIIYLYSLFSKKKISYWISIAVILLGYSYTIYTCLNLNKLIGIMPGFVGEQIQFGEGMIFYILSLGIFIVDIFIPGKGWKSQKMGNTLPDSLKKEIDLEDKYILADYIYGLKNRRDLYKKLSVIAYDGTQIEVIIEAPEPVKITIHQKDLTNFQVKLGVILSENMRTDNYDNNKFLRDVALFGSTNASIINNIRGDRVETYYKMNYTDVYDITLEYTEQNIPKKLVFQTRENPKKFLENFKKEEETK